MSYAFTYAGQLPGPFLSASGAPLTLSSISVYTVGTNTLVTLYTSRTKGTTTANPFTTDSLGNAVIFAAPGQVEVLANGTRVVVTIPADPDEAWPSFNSVVGTSAQYRPDTTLEAIGRSGSYDVGIGLLINNSTPTADTPEAFLSFGSKTPSGYTPPAGNPITGTVQLGSISERWYTDTNGNLSGMQQLKTSYADNTKTIHERVGYQQWGDEGVSFFNPGSTGPGQYAMFQKGNVKFGYRNASVTPRRALDLDFADAIIGMDRTTGAHFSCLELLDAGSQKWLVGMRNIGGGGGEPGANAYHIYNSSTMRGLVIDTNGNVGINLPDDTAPARALSLHAVSGSDLIVSMNRILTSNFAVHEYLTNSVQKWLVGMRNTSSDEWKVYSSVAAADMIRVSNVGVGFNGAAPVAIAAHPTVLSDVITILTNAGLCS